jgi:hypothetical protein
MAAALDTAALAALEPTVLPRSLLSPMQANIGALTQPLCQLALGSPGDEIIGEVYSADIDLSCATPGNHARVTLRRPWAAGTALADLKGLRARIGMGYRGVGLWRVFTGMVVESSGDTVCQLELRDGSFPLERTFIGAQTEKKYVDLKGVKDVRMPKARAKRGSRGRAQTRAAKAAKTAAAVATAKANTTTCLELVHRLLDAAAVATDADGADGYPGLRFVDVPATSKSGYVLERASCLKHVANARDNFVVGHGFWFDAAGNFHMHPWPAAIDTSWLGDVAARTGLPVDTVQALLGVPVLETLVYGQHLVSHSVNDEDTRPDATPRYWAGQPFAGPPVHIETIPRPWLTPGRVVKLVDPLFATFAEAAGAVGDPTTGWPMCIEAANHTMRVPGARSTFILRWLPPGMAPTLDAEFGDA